MKVFIIAFPELPKTFFIPISFVLDRLMNRIRPKSPNAAIIRVKSAKTETIVLRFFSEVYKLSINDSIV